MIKLLIRQGPFYISSFTALFLALAQTGWLDRMFPADMSEIAQPLMAAPAIGDALECWVAEDGEELCSSTFALSAFPDFDPNPAIEPWVLVLSFVIGGLAIGWVASRLWRRAFG